jgi:hypothetical protein
LLTEYLINTVGEHIIATTKIRNIYGAIQSFIFPILAFLYCSPFSYRSSNFAIAKVVAIVRREITLERKPSKKKQRTDTKKDAKMIKSDNFTRNNREKSNIAIFFADCIVFSRPG